jgi:hypothetical protein
MLNHTSIQSAGQGLSGSVVPPTTASPLRRLTIEPPANPPVTAAASSSPPIGMPPPAALDPTPAPATHCAACGRKFGRNPAVTFGSWLKFGNPGPDDLVHVDCQDTPRKTKTVQTAAATARRAGL